MDMVAVYSVALAIGVLGLVVVILGGAFAENIGREGADPGERLGTTGRSIIGALIGFGMAGLSAEFATWGLTWQGALIVALIGAVAGTLWVRYASSRGSGSDAGPV